MAEGEEGDGAAEVGHVEVKTGGGELWEMGKQQDQEQDE